MPLFNVSAILETTIVVYAEDESHAIQVANEDFEESLNNIDLNPSLFVDGRIQDKSDLKDGWDDYSIPYGRDDDKTILEILRDEK